MSNPDVEAVARPIEIVLATRARTGVPRDYWAEAIAIADTLTRLGYIKAEEWNPIETAPKPHRSDAALIAKYGATQGENL